MANDISVCKSVAVEMVVHCLLQINGDELKLKTHGNGLYNTTLGQLELLTDP